MPLWNSTRLAVFAEIGNVSSMPIFFISGLRCAARGAAVSANAPARNVRREVMAAAILRCLASRHKREPSVAGGLQNPENAALSAASHAQSVPEIHRRNPGIACL